MSRAVRKAPSRFSRRRWVAALLVLTALVVGCTPPGLPPPQSPSAQSSAPTTTAPVAQIVVGVDGVITGFNPHTIADFSPATQAVAALVLPSTTVTRTDGSTWFDPAVVSRAEVTSTTPFVVTYTLNRQAAWSDGTPVTAEDFSYLRDQMIDQPGTVDPAGYRLITAIRSRDAGKTVTVEFAAGFPDWPSLFSPLLPAHILKDAPGGFTDGLDTGIGVSAGRYKMESFDTVTGQITLVRNDKYWLDTAGPATVVLRIGVPAELLAGLVRGDLQAMLARPDGVTAAELDRQVPADRRVVLPLPATVQLVLNTTGTVTADPLVRRAIAAAIDLPTLRQVLTGNRSGGLWPAASATRLPDRTATAAASARADPEAARKLLADAGYDTTGSYALRNGAKLRLTLGVATRSARGVAAARQIQIELGRAGIELDLLLQSAGPLITTGVATGTVDLALLTVPRARSDAVAGASAFACGAVDAVRTGNLSGYCSAGPEATMRDALAGTADVGAIDVRLGQDVPVIVLGQPTAVLAVGPALLGIVAGAGPGWLWTGPLAGLPDWPTG